MIERRLMGRISKIIGEISSKGDIEISKKSKKIILVSILNHLKNLIEKLGHISSEKERSVLNSKEVELILLREGYFKFVKEINEEIKKCSQEEKRKKRFWKDS